MGDVARPRPSRNALAFAVSAAFAASATSALANPSGATIVRGGVTFSVNGGVLTITNTPGAIINWQQFSIARDEITRFIQQHAASTVLNRVVGQNPSLILGSLVSNGRVFLINPSGIAFGQGAMIDVAGFAASTLNISDADFVSGRMRFMGSGAEGKLTNAGTIRTPEGGHVYLIAPNVENQASGVITSPKGEVVIAAGKTVELVNARTPDIRVEFTAPQGEAVNAGEIVAAAGTIGVYGNLVRNSGRVSASRAEVGDGGKIVFKSTDMTLVSGTVEAKAEAGKGGEIQILGRHVGLVDNALVEASGELGGGTILVGGDFQGKNPEVLNAEKTYVGRDAVIRADAVTNGDGGKVIVWSDDTTRFYGSLSARGGSEGGNGGFAEISGKVNLDASIGRVDLGAPKGGFGTLLLDPQDIVINGGTGDGDDHGAGSGILVEPPGPGVALGEVVFADTPTTGAFHVYESELEGTNANIMLQATNSITVAGTFNLDTNGEGTGSVVRLKNNRSLILDTQNAAGDGSGATAAAGINLSGVEFQTQGTGAITIRSGVTGTSAGAESANISLGALTTLGGGAISVQAANGSVTAGGAISSGAGAVSLSASGSIDVNAAVSNTSSVSLATTGGAISQSGGSISSGTLTTISATGTALTGANTVANFNATNTSGTVSLTNTATTLNVTGVTQGTNASVTISNTGNLTTTGAVVAGGTGTISLAATGSGNAQLGANVTSGSGNINVTAANDLIIGNGVTVSTTGGVSLTATAGQILENGLTAGKVVAGSLTTLSAMGQTLSGSNQVGAFNATNTSSGAITLSNTASPLNVIAVSQSSGDGVSITNSGGLNVGSINSGGAVALSAGGAITDGNGATTNVTAGSLTAIAAGGIALDTAVADISATNTAAGNIALSNTNAAGVFITGSNTASGGGFLVTEAAGSLNVVAGGITTQGGTVSLTSAAGAVMLNDAIATLGGDVIIDAATSVTANSTITTTAATNSGVKSGDVTIAAVNSIAVNDTIDTRGASNNIGTGSQAGAVALTTGGGTLFTQDVLATGGAGTAANHDGGAGGEISLNAEFAPIQIFGVLDARGGAPDGTGTVGVGGAIKINDVATPGAVTLQNSVTTNDADIEVRGSAITQNGSLISTTGIGDVSIISTGSALTLDGTVSLGSGLLTIGSADDLNLDNTIVTQGGDVAISAANTIHSAATSSITTTAAIDSGVQSGDVSITSTGGDITLEGTIVTTGASRAGASGSAAGAVSITAGFGFVTLVAGGGISAHGGAVTAGSADGGAGGAVSLNATGSVEVAAAVNAGGGAGLGAGTKGVGGAISINNTSPNPSLVNAHPTGSLVTNDAPISIEGVNVKVWAGGSVQNAGTGTILIDAGTGSLTNEGTISNSGGTGAITLAADRMILEGGSVVGGSAIVAVRQSTDDVSIYVGTVGDTQSWLELSEAELNTISTTGTLRIGNANTEFFNLSDSVDITSATTVRLQASGSVWSNGHTIGASRLALVSNGGGIDIIAATSDLAASTPGGGVSVFNATAGTLNVTGVDGIAGLLAGTSAVTLTEATGNVTLSQPVSGTTVAITLDGNDKLLTNSSTITATGTVALTADKMALGGAISAAGQTVTLRSKQNGDAISVGVVGDGSAGTLELSDAELDTITAANVTIGAASQNGGIAVGGNFSTTSANLTLATGGAITSAAGTLSTGGAGNLTLSAVSGIGTLGSPILIGNVGGSLSATNTISGALALNIADDTLTVGAGGGISQFAGGSIRLDQTASVAGTGTMTIGGNITAGTGGTIILNADGVLARTAGTLTADTIELGTAGTTTQIGTAGAPILLRSAAGTASPSVTAQLTTAGTEIALEQTAGPLTTANYRLITNAGTGQNVLLATTDGDITISGTVSGFGIGSTGSSNDNITLDANGVTRNIDGTQSIAANELTLSASGAIGAFGTPLNTSVNTLSASAAGGDVVVLESSGVALDGISASGNIQIVATAGDITTSGTITGGGIELSALAETGNVTISNDVIGNGSGPGGLSVYAGNNITLSGVDISHPGGQEFGVFLNSDRTGSSGVGNGAGRVAVINSTITTNDGAILIGGGATPTLTTFAVGVAGATEGVLIDGSTLDAGAGTISLRGTGFNGAGGANTGVLITGSSLTSTAGDVTITGLGGTGGSANHGVHILNSTVTAGDLSSTGLTVSGTGIGSGSHGVVLENGGVIESTGTATINVTGVAGAVGGFGIMSVASGANRIGSTNAAGDITLTADTVNIESDFTLQQAAGHIVTIRPNSGGRQIDLGGADSGTALGLTQAELAAVNASTLRVGSAAAGAITISTDVTPTNLTNLHLISGGGVTGTAGGIAGDKNLAITAVGPVNITAASTAVDNLVINVTGAGNSIVFTGETNGFTVGALVDGEIGIRTASNAAGSSGGIALSSGGAVTLNAAVTSGNASLADAAGDQTPTSGSVSITGVGIAGDPNGFVRTGNATLTGADQAGNDSATSGSVTLNAGSGALGLTATSPIQIGAASRTGGGAVDTAVGGNLSLAASEISAGGSSALQISMATPTGAATNTQGTFSAAATGAGANGEIRVSSSTNLRLGTLDTADGDATTVDIALTTGATTLTFTTTSNLDIDNATFSADRMDIGAGSGISAANSATLQQGSLGRTINLGSATDVGTGLELSSAEIGRITAGTLRIGRASGGGSITFTTDIAPAAGVGSVHLRGTTVTGTLGGLTGNKNLAISASGTVNMVDASTDVSNLAISAPLQDVTFTEANGFTVGAVDSINAVTGLNVNLTATLGDLTVSNVTGNDITAAGVLNVAALGNDAKITIAGGANVNAPNAASTFTADKIDIAGTITATGQTVTLKSANAGDSIRVGIAGDATVNTLEMSDAELDAITATTVVVGSGTQTGGIDVAGNFNTTSAHLTLTSGSTITSSAGSLGTGGTGNLTLNAVSGIGNIGGLAPVAIGAVGGNLSATNTTSGDLYLSTGAITVGTAGITLAQQASLGHLRVDSSGGIVIGGDLTAGVLGNGAITLNPTGTLTRTAGTLTADLINLGTDGNASAIGASGAPIMLAGGTANPAVAAVTTGVGGVFLNQETGDLLTSKYAIYVDAVGQTIQLATTDGHITVDHNYTTHWNANTQDDHVTLIASGTDKDINRGGAAVLVTSGGVTLNASGGIGTTSVVVLDSAGDLSFTTAGASTVGNVVVSEIRGGGFNTNRVTTLATDGTSEQTVSLTYGPSVAADFTIGASFGNTQDNLTLTSTNGNIVGAGTATANILSLNTLAGGIGVGTAINTETVILRASATTTVDVLEATAVQLGDGVGGVTSSGGNISIATTNGAITTGNAVATTGGNGSITLTSGGTNGITLDHAVSAHGTGIVTLSAGAASSQGAGGNITAAKLELLGTGSYTLTNAGNDVGTIAANTGLGVSYRDANDLIVGTAGGTTGISNLGADVSLQTGGTLAINGAISIGGGDLTLNTGGAATQTATITASGLELLGTGPYTLTLAGNNVSTLAGSVTNAVQYTDANALTVGQVNTTQGLTASDIVLATGGIGTDDLTLTHSLNAGTGGVRLVTLGALSQTGGTLTAGNLGVRAGAGATLAQPGNDVDTLAVLITLGNPVSYRDTDGFTIGTVGASGAFTSLSGITATGNPVTLHAGGLVTQATSADNIIASSLELLGSGPYTLTNTGNNVATLAGSVTGAVQYTDANALTVGQVNATQGLTASDIVLATGGISTDNLTLTHSLNAGAGGVRLVTNGAVAQSGGSLTAGSLGVRAGAGAVLAQPGNNVDTLAVLITLGNPVSYRDTDGFAIGTVGTAGAFASVSGITATGNPVTLHAGGLVTQTSSADNITASSLELLGSGPYTLTNTGNNVATLAGSVTGAVQYTDANALTVDTVNTTVGLAATDIVLVTGGIGTDNLTLAQNVNAGTGDVRLVTNGAVTQTGGAITADELGVRSQSGVTLTSAGNNAATVAMHNGTGNAVSYTDTNGFAIGTVGALGGFTATSGITNSGQNVTLTAGAAVTQTQAITAAGLELLGAGSYALTLATNDVNTLAVGTDGAVSLRDADDLVVGTVNTIGITTSSDNVVLQTGTTLAITQAVSLAGGNLTLDAGGATTQTASITATGLELLGTGPYALTNAGNNVATIAASTGGAISYTDSNALAVGTVNGTSGITTTGSGAVTLNILAGALTLPATIGTINADGAVSLTAAAGISTAANITTTDDAIGFNSATTLTGDVVLNTGAAGTAVATFGSTLNGANDLTVQGAATFNGIVGGGAALASLAVTGATVINTSAINTTTTQDYGGAVTFTTGLTLTGSTVTFDSTLDGANTLSISGNAAFNDVVGGLSPLTSLQVSGATGIGASAISTAATQTYGGAVSLVSDTTLTGSVVTFNSTVDGGQALAVDAAAVFNNAVGNSTALDSLDVSGAANVNTGILTATGGITFGSSLTGPGTLNDLAVRAGSGAFSVTGALTNVNNLTVHTASDVTLTNPANAVSGTVTFVSATGAVDYREADAITLGASAITGSARVISGNGGITTTGAIAADGGIALVAHDGVTGGNSGTITINAPITTQGTAVTLNAADDITVNGLITTNDGDVDIVAGNSTGINYGAIRLPAGTTAADEADTTGAGSGDNFGRVHFQQGVHAGTGNIVVVTAGDANNTPSQSNVTQSASGELVSSNLTVITLKGSGGLGAGVTGADIVLNTSGNNDNTSVRFFACESAGCPAPALSGPTVPVNFNAARQYAPGQILYTGLNGVNLAGLGTVGDFYSFVTGSFTLTANPFSAGNVTIESTEDIIIDLAQSLLAISTNSSSSLNFLAKRDILYVNRSYNGDTAGGGTIGEAGNPFNNHLNMTAGRSVLLENSLYQNTQNLLLAANQSFTSPFQTVTATGVGDVTLQGNYTVRTGGSVTVRGRNFSVLGGDTGGDFQSATGQQLIAAGAVNLMNTGVIIVKAGTAITESGSANILPADRDLYPSGSGALVQGGTVNIGQAGGANNPTLLYIQGGDNAVGALGNDPQVASKQSDAIVRSTGDMNIYLGHVDPGTVPGGVGTLPLGGDYSLIVRGGSATANNSGTVPLNVGAQAVLQANRLTLETEGTILFQGGTAELETTNALAAANARLLVSDEKTITTRNGGSVLVVGGTANVDAADARTGAPMTTADAPNSQAFAQIDPSKLTMTVDGILVLQGGTTTGPAGAVASARIDAGDEIKITVNGTGTYSYGSSGALGPASFFMIGGPDSGFFDKNNVDLAGGLSYPQAFPITVTLAGAFLRVTDSGLAGSVVQTGLTTFDDSLLSYIIFAANEETRAVRILRRFDEEDTGVAACR